MSFDRAMLRLVAVSQEPAGSAEEFLDLVAAAVRGGATSIELRAKTLEASKLVELTRALVARVTVPVIVNDRADVAIAGGAAGVHLGVADLPCTAVRAFAPDGFIIGASVGSEDELAHARGSDYVGVGPVYATGSKSDAGTAIGVQEMARLIRATGCPGVGVGGIDASNARAVIAAGADGVAVVSSIFGAPDPEAAARAVRSAIGK